MVVTPLPPMDELEDEESASQTTSRPTLKRMGSVRKQPYFSNLRFQLQEQLKSLDGRVETQVALTSELQEFFRRRAEVELEYSRSLDKLAKTLSFRQKELKSKRDHWHLFSVSNCWQHLISQTKKQSKEHAILADIYNTHVTTRLSYVGDDLQRIYKQCKEVGIEAHEELLKVLHELHTSTKTFHAYQAESRQAEAKLKLVEAQKSKLELAIPKEKIERSKKIRLVDKEIQKRKSKYTDARIKALKAKNEYILCMDAANAAVQKYFVDDLSDLIDCMDLGFYQCISRALNMYLSTQDQMKKSLQSNVETLAKFINAMDSRLDKQKFLEANNSSFIMPKKFEFQPPVLKGEEVDLSEPAELEASGMIRQELEQRLLQLHRRLDTLRTESDELWKTLETAESSLLGLLSSKDYDTTQYFEDITKAVPKQPETITLKNRADRHETDEFHLNKFRDYMLGTNRIARLQAKYEHIRKVLGETDQGGSSPALAQTLAGPQPARKVRRKRIGQLKSSGIPRLFSGSLEEYLEVTNQDIPLVMKSCIRVINLYGLHHQGIFRVSGSQLEINNFRDAFERGDDPLADVNDASDINSVAGVLKLYLRELREPLFPIVYFEQFMELAELKSKQVFVSKMTDLVKSLPRPVFVVLRYLFAFLNHLSEFSDENMMDPYNLAICFGPTLVPVPEDKDQKVMYAMDTDFGFQVQYQNLVNELIKNVIIYAEDIFPDDGGIVYEKYISKEPDEGDVGDAPTDQSQDELDSEICPSEDDSVFKEKDISLNIFGKSEFLEAIAQFDFAARSKREVSFNKGDLVTLYSQVSGDWWKGSVNGIDGLIPDKYILLKIRGEDKERLDSTGSTKEEFIHQRNRTASDSFLSTQPKPLSISLSPSLQGGENRRHLGVKSPACPASPQSFLGVSGESLASTSPDSPSEFGVMDKEPTFRQPTAPSEASASSSKPPPHQLLTVQTHGTPVRSLSLATPPLATSTPTVSSCHHAHQRSMSVTEDRAYVSHSPHKWKEGLAEEAKVPGEAIHAVVGVARKAPPPPVVEVSAATESLLAISLPEEKQDEVTVVKEKKRLSRQSTPERSAQSSSSSASHLEPKDDEASSINMSFSTPKSVDNDDAPPIDTNLMMATDQYDAQQANTRLGAKLDSIQKAHAKNKSWDLTTHPNDCIPMESTAGNVDRLVAKVPLHTKSKSEDYERGSGKEKPKFQSNVQFWEMRSRFGPSSHTPDLVMDLPLVSSGPGSHTGETSSTGSSSPSSSGSSSPTAESPESVVMTAAECFAKQDQCTLKKNHPSGSRGPEDVKGSETTTFSSRMEEVVGTGFQAAKSQISLFESSSKDPKIGIAKPQVKVKPQVLKKPLFPAQLIEKIESKVHNLHHHHHHHHAGSAGTSTSSSTTSSSSSTSATSSASSTASSSSSQPH